jgi:hypothetical protein
MSETRRATLQFVAWAAAGLVSVLVVGSIWMRRTPPRGAVAHGGARASAVIVPLPAPASVRGSDESAARPAAVARSHRVWSSRRGPHLAAAPALATAPPFEELYVAHRPLAIAWSRAAARDLHSYAPGLNACARALKERRAGDGPPNRAIGSVAVTFEVKDGVARVTSIRPQGGCDEAFADCFKAGSPWANQAIDAVGEKDGTYEAEWPFRLATR